MKLVEMKKTGCGITEVRTLSMRIWLKELEELVDKFEH